MNLLTSVTLTIPTASDGDAILAAANDTLDVSDQRCYTVEDAIAVLLLENTSLGPRTPVWDACDTFPLTIEFGSHDDWQRDDADWGALVGHTTGRVLSLDKDGDCECIIYTADAMTSAYGDTYFSNDPASVTEFLAAALDDIPAGELCSLFGQVLTDHLIKQTQQPQEATTA